VQDGHAGRRIGVVRLEKRDQRASALVFEGGEFLFDAAHRQCLGRIAVIVTGQGMRQTQVLIAEI